MVQGVVGSIPITHPTPLLLRLWIPRFFCNFHQNEIALENAYPNPFNPSTNISFSVPNAMHVDLSIYDANGRMVEQLVNDVKSTGVYEISWNAGLNASGVYFIRFNADGDIHTQKILLIK